ncbi:MAG: HAMP domain-containing sensor histidine kinase [Cyanobacteria bacterium J06592_8]
MFQKIRNQLILSYLAVFLGILTVFVIAVRISFARSLNQQLMTRLEVLAKAAVTNYDIENGEIDIDEDETIVNQNQTTEWFDVDQNLVAHQGDYPLTLPLNQNQAIQQQFQPFIAKGLTVPIYSEDPEELIGYTRVSESTQELKSLLQKLDLGLAGGVAIALILSGTGGIWLTRQAMQPIEESFQKLKQFTSDASHELRSPLMAIKSNVAVALEYPQGISESELEKFQMIESAANQMTRLTENLLLLARTDRADLAQKKIINLSVLLEELIQLYEPQSHRKNIELTSKIDQELYFQGDEGLLQQLFTNLIQNAIYYTPSEGFILIQASRIHTHLIVKVQDTGIGIAPEHQEKIFERFWRAEKSRSYQAGKSGLGLSISQAIAQKHGGLITVESQLGLGSCFTVRFPYKP